MSHFVLVHGAWLGAWCWDHVAGYLREAGHEVLAPELPGHGADQTPLSEISLTAYVDKVAEAAKPGSIVAGHSMAGIVISQLAERMPDRIPALIYVAAYLLRNGENMTAISASATDSLVGPNMDPAPDWSTIGIKRAGLTEVFAADAPAADLERLHNMARPEPAGPFNEPVQITAERFGSVRRFYVATLQDRAVTPMLQQKMLAATPCEQVMTMDTSHCPFFAQPKELANIMIKLTSYIEGAKS